MGNTWRASRLASLYGMRTQTHTDTVAPFRRHSDTCKCVGKCARRATRGIFLAGRTREKAGLERGAHRSPRRRRAEPPTPRCPGRHPGTRRGAGGRAAGTRRGWNPRHCPGRGRHGTKRRGFRSRGGRKLAGPGRGGALVGRRGPRGGPERVGGGPRGKGTGRGQYCREAGLPGAGPDRLTRAGRQAGACRGRDPRDGPGTD